MKHNQVGIVLFTIAISPARMNFTQATGLIYAELTTWIRTAVRYLPNLAVAILVLVVFTFLARLVSRQVVRGFDRFSHNASLINLSGALIRVLIIAVGLFVALGVLGLDKALTSLLAGAGVIALAVGFAFQDLTANFISGTMIALARPVQVGDLVETNGFMGNVLDIKLRSIVIDNGKGQTVEIPSKDVFQKPITNYSRMGQRRIEITAGVSYLDNLATVQRVAKATISSLPFLVPNKSVDLHYRNFGDNSVQFILWFWINPATTNALFAQSEAMIALKRTFEQNHILFMFPPYTFDLKQKMTDQQQTNQPDKTVA